MFSLFILNCSRETKFKEFFLVSQWDRTNFDCQSMSITIFTIFAVQTLNDMTRYIITTVEDDRANDLLNVKSELVSTSDAKSYIENEIRNVMSKGILPITGEPVFFSNTFDKTYDNNRIKSDSVNVRFNHEREFGDGVETDGRVLIFVQQV